MIFDVWFFYFDPVLIPNATSQPHDVAAVFQLHSSSESLKPINLIWFIFT